MVDRFLSLLSSFLEKNRCKQHGDDEKEVEEEVCEAGIPRCLYLSLSCRPYISLLFLNQEPD